MDKYKKLNKPNSSHTFVGEEQSTEYVKASTSKRKYRKIAQQNPVFDEEEDEEYDSGGNHAPQNDLEYPMSYIKCGRCPNIKIESCSCDLFKNYYCPRCSWSHINHHHKVTDASYDSLNLGSSVIEKNIRK